MSEINEPHPVEEGKTWETDSPQFQDRLEYISARVEEYLDKFRESVVYNFSRMDARVVYNQERVLNASLAFAAGTVKLSEIAKLSAALRDSFARNDNNVFDSVDPNASPGNVPRPGAAARQQQEAKRRAAPSGPRIPSRTYNYSPRGPQLSRYEEWERSIREKLDTLKIEYRRAWEHRLFCDRKKRPPDVVSKAITGGYGYNEYGDMIGGEEAHQLIREELESIYLPAIEKAQTEFWEALRNPPAFSDSDYRVVSYNDIVQENSTPPQEGISAPPPQKQKVETAGRSLDDIRAEQEKARFREADKKRRKKLNL